MNPMKRLALVRAIDAKQIRHYHWVTPHTRNTATDAVVTADVDELVASGAAYIPLAAPGDYSIVALTEAGRVWLAESDRHIEATREQR